MRNLGKFSLFACAVLAQLEEGSPRFGILPQQDFPTPNPDFTLLKRAAFADPLPQSTCPGNYKICGADCIPPSYTCCSDGGGCPSTDYCTTSGGCCALGKLCSGPPVACPTGTKSCPGATCIPNADPCPTTAGVSTLVLGTSTAKAGTPTTSASGAASTSDSYSSKDGTCVAGFKLCGTYWCILSTADCCNSGQFSCRAGLHCTTTNCATTCTSGEKQCGRGCIIDAEDCCGDDGDYCPSDSYCSGAKCLWKSSTRTSILNSASKTTQRPGTSSINPYNTSPVGGGFLDSSSTTGFTGTTTTSPRGSTTSSTLTTGGLVGPTSDATPVHAYLTSKTLINTFILIVLAIFPLYLRMNGRL